jgi:hypothetical protein
MIEQLVKFLAKALLNKQAGNHRQALAEIESAFGSILGFNSLSLTTLSVTDISELFGISREKSAAGIKCIIAAKLLMRKAEIQESIDKDIKNSIPDYTKALGLFLEGILNAGDHDFDLKEFYADTGKIAKILDDNLSEEIRAKLFDFYALQGEYAKAEDELFHLKRTNFPGIKIKGIEFYKILKTRSEAELNKGNLTREEAEEGLLDFLKEKHPEKGPH